MPPLVLFDATPLAGRDNDRADAAWVRGVLHGLSDVPVAERPHLLLGLGDPAPTGFVAHRLPVRPGAVARRFSRPGVGAVPEIEHADLVHLSSEVAVDVFAPVVTCLDLLPLRFPTLEFGARSATARRRYNAYLERLAGARLILTPSSSVAADLQELLAIPAGRIRVAAFAASPVIAPVSDPPARPSVLVVANREPLTNADLAIQALAAGDPDIGLELVIAGVADRRRRERLVRRAVALGVGARVRVLGVLSVQALATLRATATLAAVPALAGAASVPAVTALAAGIPLLASDITDLDEMVGPAALRLPVGRPDEWGQALTALVADPARRRAMADAGRIYAARQSWADTAGVVRTAWAEACGA